MDHLKKSEDFFNEIFNAVDWEISDSEIVKSLLVSLREASELKFGITFGFSSNNEDRAKETLSNCYQSPNVVEEIKTRTMGSSMVRYFTQDTDTNSKEKKYTQQLEYGSNAEIDKDLKRIISSPNLPSDLLLLKIELNKVIFVSPKYKTISARPDGTCLIDKLVSPVELLTSKLASEMARYATYDQIRQKADTDYSSIIDEAKTSAKNSIAMSKSGVKERSRGNSKKVVEKKDEDYDPNKRSRKKPIKYHTSERILGEETYSEKKKRESEKKSISQRTRRYIEHLTFVNSMPPVRSLNEKKQQLYAQMISMQVSKGLLLYWNEETVYYSVLSLPAKAAKKISEACDNFDKWIDRFGS